MSKDWIQGRLGGKVFPACLDPEQVELVDIASGLCHESRFNGQYNHEDFYSVAEHCVWVSRVCDPKDAMAGLLHDASEAYLKDIPTPLKNLPDMSGYRRLEEEVTRTIYRRFGLVVPTMPDSVRDADAAMLAVEVERFKAPVHPDWTLPEVKEYLRGRLPTKWQLGALPSRAYFLFMERFAELVSKEEGGSYGIYKF